MTQGCLLHLRPQRPTNVPRETIYIGGGKYVSRAATRKLYREYRYPLWKTT